MKTMIDWLIGVEDSAYRVYSAASEFFSSDREFSDLLAGLGEDEEKHRDAIMRIRNLINSGKDATPVVSLDGETMRAIERPLIECESRLRDGTITKEDMLGYMVDIEYSEVNKIFQYVDGSLGPAIRSNRHGEAAKTDPHIKKIEDYLKTLSGAERLMERVRRLPGSNGKKILVVDDMDVNLQMLKAILEKMGEVDMARNGRDALEKVSLERYSAIVSDVEMPVLDGIGFYSMAEKRFPSIKNRFLFYTSSLDHDKIAFFRDNSIRYLIKPTAVSNIRKTVKEMLDA